MAIPRRPAEASGLTSDYDVNLHIYPESLAWLKDNQNYVAFYINVPGNSTFAANTIGDLQDLPNGIAAGKQGTLKIESPPYKRLKSAIVLPIMERPVARYSADWDNVALGPIVGHIMTAGAPGSNGTFMADAAGQLGMDSIKAIGLAMANAALPNSLDGETSAKDIFSAIRRQAINDKRTQLFRTMRFREFSFEYHMAPRSEGEARNIRQIIQTFKLHMHPDSAKGNLFLTYPSEFDIVFYFKGDENVAEEPDRRNLFKNSTCALVDMSVEYGGDVFYTFDDGMPTEIMMRLNFIELELMTKERIAEGF